MKTHYTSLNMNNYAQPSHSNVSNANSQLASSAIGFSNNTSGLGNSIVGNLKKNNSNLKIGK